MIILKLCCSHVDRDKENHDVAQEDESPPEKRRRILVLDSEDSEDEYKPSKSCRIKSCTLCFEGT
jgi:hypothetical protein